MRRLRVAFAACTLLVAPVALLAQQPSPGQHPVVKPIPGVRPLPRPTRPYPRPNNRGRTSSGAYPVIIDSSVVNRFLGTPSPTPQHKPTPKPRPTNYHGQDVFETHSTEDNAR